MSKFYGKVGFAETLETSPSVYTDSIIERNYFGDVYRVSNRWEKGSSVNDDFNINNEIEIVADPYALKAFHSIKYVEWKGTLWKVNSITVNYPRLRLSIGGVYNGPTP